VERGEERTKKDKEDRGKEKRNRENKELDTALLLLSFSLSTVLPYL